MTSPCGLWRAWAFLLLMAISMASHADVRCPALFKLDGEKNTYYALVFLDAASEQDRDRLSSEISPLLTSVSRNLATKSGAKRIIKVELVVCEHHLSSKDFSHDEMREYLQYKVLAVFWKSQEGLRHGLAQLAIPAYLHNPSALRREIEVVTLYDDKADESADSWIEAFNQDTAPYKPFVAMGLATVYQSAQDYVSALAALCVGRTSLTALAPNALRPRPDAFDSAITPELKSLTSDLEAAAKRAGIKTIPPCALPSAVLPAAP
jgi:hypothetical protein